MPSLQFFIRLVIIKKENCKEKERERVSKSEVLGDDVAYVSLDRGSESKNPTETWGSEVSTISKDQVVERTQTIMSFVVGSNMNQTIHHCALCRSNYANSACKMSSRFVGA